MNFIIGNDLIEYVCKTNEEYRLLRNILSFETQNIEFIRRNKNIKWDGIYRFYKNNTFKTGLMYYVLLALEEKGVKYKITDQRYKIDFDFEIDPRLRPHQVEAVQDFFSEQFGIIKSPTRSGKTFIASECIRIVSSYEETKDFKILFVVDSKDLFQQSLREISDYLGIKKSQIGQINGPNFDICNINIAMIQTLQSFMSTKRNTGSKESVKQKREKRKKIKDLLESVDFLIVDEVHEFSSESRIDVLSYSRNLKLRLALSATPFKSESELSNMKIREKFGEVICDIKEDDLEKAGFLTQDKILLLTIDHDKQNLVYNKDIHEGVGKYRFFLDRCIYSPERDKLLYLCLKELDKLRLKTLVLFNVTSHGRTIAEMTGLPFISGEDDMSTREREKSLFLEKDGGILLASNIYKKGVTLPAVEVMINADGGKEQSLLIQRKGRTRATTETKKKTLTIDFMDFEHNYFTEHSLSRLQVYENTAGEDNIVVLNEEILMEDSRLLNDFLVTWFEL